MKGRKQEREVGLKGNMTLEIDVEGTYKTLIVIRFYFIEVIYSHLRLNNFPFF